MGSVLSKGGFQMQFQRSHIKYKIHYKKEISTFPPGLVKWNFAIILLCSLSVLIKWTDNGARTNRFKRFVMQFITQQWMVKLPQETCL